MSDTELLHEPKTEPVRRLKFLRVPADGVLGQPSRRLG